MPEVNTPVNEPEETPEDRFVRIGQRRVSRLVHDIGLIGNLATGAYRYDQAQINKMFAAVDTALDRTKAAFTTALSKRNGTTRPDFTF